MEDHVIFWCHDKGVKDEEFDSDRKTDEYSGEEL